MEVDLLVDEAELDAELTDEMTGFAMLDAELTGDKVELNAVLPSFVTDAGLTADDKELIVDLMVDTAGLDVEPTAELMGFAILDAGLAGDKVELDAVLSELVTDAGLKTDKAEVSAESVGFMSLDAGLVTDNAELVAELVAKLVAELVAELTGFRVLTAELGAELTGVRFLDSSRVNPPLAEPLVLIGAE